MKRITVIGDTDGLIAFINPEDANNEKANRSISFMQKNDAILYFPTTTIAETVTTLQRKHASPILAQKVIDQCKEGNLSLIAVDTTIITNAINLFNPYGSKQNTFFDAIVASIAKKSNVDAIFSFDEWYRKIGLTLIESIY